MKIQPSDLVLRFDETSSKVLLLVPKSPGETETLKRFFEVSVPEEITVAEFAEDIGVAVASFMHGRHSNRFKVDGAADGSRSASSEEVNFEDARLLIDRLGDSSTLTDVDAVSVLLKRASEVGDQEATRYLQETWPGLRAVFVRRIARNDK